MGEGCRTDAGPAGQSLEYTQEYSRVGAIKGIVTYADGTVLNLFTEYGLVQPPPISFPFSVTPATGAVRQMCQTVIRTMATNLDGQMFSGVEAICGDAFFDALIMSPETRVTYLNTQAAADLRTSYVAGGQTWGSFEFGGILWTNYRGYAQITRWSKPARRISIRPACPTCSRPCSRLRTTSRQ